jgi:hypothetical protein
VPAFPTSWMDLPTCWWSFLLLGECVRFLRYCVDSVYRWLRVMCGHCKNFAPYGDIGGDNIPESQCGVLKSLVATSKFHCFICPPVTQ